METKAKIRQFFERSLQRTDLPDDENIFAAGLVNSLFAMQLVLFVESEFGFSTDNDDLVIDNFSSINAIASLVDRKLGVTA
ncbi:MAG: acyl carrier protein [Chloroflexi bacterium]|nr:acyl carrier protein [Chloroflexota bacterium]